LKSRAAIEIEGSGQQSAEQGNLASLRYRMLTATEIPKFTGRFNDK
jgi:hypothetical protein